MQSSDEDGESNDEDSSCAADQMSKKDQASQSNQSAEEDKVTVIYKCILGSIFHILNLLEFFRRCNGS